LQDDAGVEGVLPDMATYDRMGKSLETGLLGILSVKRGIQRLQDRVETVAADEPLKDGRPVKVEEEKTRGDSLAMHQHSAPSDAADDCAICRSKAHLHPVMTYMQLPIPSLFHRAPKFRLAPLGIAIVVFSAWYLVETVFCALYCPPTLQSCYFNTMIGRPCRLSSVRPPSFGTALPIKLDEWLADGRGRDALGDAVEWTTDTAADAWDMLLGREIGPDDAAAAKDSEARKSLRRRLWRRGLLRGREDAGEGDVRAQLGAWRAERLARERVAEARNGEWDYGDAETMGQDEAL
jgi:hypothetical protein